MTLPCQLILASASPRRRELLAQLGFSKPDFSFISLSADIDESHKLGESPQTFVVRLAVEKAQAGLALFNADTQVAVEGKLLSPLVLGSDTIVVLGDKILGKPADEADALKILSELSGHMHIVMTAVALTDGVNTSIRLVETKVKFCELSEVDILAYIATGEPMDKAGAYGIQALGGSFVESIEGSYSSVVGLPMVETRTLLREMSVL
ncbi:Maf family nucleotide pyrophosphatase [Shewanella sp. D64]|uniref:Maf family protein n=1 Tax=unclassified Shewanella TaxID=196818 RepID=UPI0022BA6E3E|nr:MULTISPECIES: Maf family protein [unclassified Shewanella]MEC4725459.1 Maf family nucleotide pyrophosphatase [Shewanella sp. D64]MEC4738722.1 Maf family nucleotide pyrophosphatase [Shewanella sp. E94]WBJ95016.1 Maf family nucleotide pyrophosphatase [Shewanella sp. MTB7]